MLSLVAAKEKTSLSFWTVTQSSFQTQRLLLSRMPWAAKVSARVLSLPFSLARRAWAETQATSPRRKVVVAAE